jgi:histidyl-tRNA synthetase
VIGSDEINSGIFTLKNLSTGTQDKLTKEEIIKRLV